MNNIRIKLAFLAALLLSVVGAVFSIIGLSKLFAGAGIGIVIFASFLEFGKIVVASFLQGHTGEIGWINRIYLFIAAFVIMMITSAGIYGYLTDGYQKTAHKYSNIQKQVEIIDKKEELIKSQIKRYEDLIKSRSDRENTLTTLRNAQETRIDNLLNNNRNSTARSTQRSINDANEEVKQINVDISKYNQDISVLNDSISVYETQKLNLSNSNDVAEIGSLKYISDLTGKPMDSVANWIILLLVFVCDPLAIGLLISAQSVVDKRNKNGNEPIANTNLVYNLFDSLKRKIKKKEEPIVEEKDVVIPDSKPVDNSKEETVEEELEEKELLKELTIDTDDTKGFDLKKEKDFESFYQKQVENIKKYRTKFVELIDVLYDGGKVKAGEDLLNYVEFTKKVEDDFIDKFSIDDIKRFLVLCNYLEITSLNNGERKALVEFDEAKKTLEKWFSK